MVQYFDAVDYNRLLFNPQLQEMADVLSEHLTQDSQVKLYRGTVLTILKKCGEELPLDVSEQVTSKSPCTYKVLDNICNSIKFSGRIANEFPTLCG